MSKCDLSPGSLIPMCVCRLLYSTALDVVMDVCIIQGRSTDYATSLAVIISAHNRFLTRPGVDKEGFAFRLAKSLSSESFL